MKKITFILASIVLIASCSSSPSTSGVTGSFSYEVDGVKKTGTYQLPPPNGIQGSCAYSSNSGFASVSLKENSVDPSRPALIIYVPLTPRTGNFTLNNNSFSQAQNTYNFAIYSFFQNNVAKGYSTYQDSRSSMNVTITSYNANTTVNNPYNLNNVGLVKGTFSGTLYDQAGSGQKISITNGVFEAVNMN